MQSQAGRRNSLTGIVIMLAVGLATESLPAAQNGPVFRDGVDLVPLAVTVTDRQGRLVPDLVAEDFVILEGGAAQSVRFFAQGAAPASEVHLGLLLDVSLSMEDDMAFMRTASIKFLNTLTEAVDVTLVDFDAEVRVAQYAQRESARLVERIRTRTPRGQTSLFDAVGVYLDGAAEQHGRKIMLLYTDGGDSGSALRLNELLDLVKASDVTIYAIGVLNRSFGVEQLALRQIAEATGGQAFFPLSVSDLDKVYRQVTAEIRAQYTLGYVSTNPRADGSWRKVEIRLKRPDTRGFRVRSRNGYYAALRP